jgi:hypothetical protein
MFEAESTVGYKKVHPGQFVMNIMLAWNGSYAVSELEGIISPAYCVFDFVDECDKKHAVTTVLVGGSLSSHKGVNLPNIHLPISALTEKDKDDLEFALKLGVDWVCLSFVQKVADVKLAKKLNQMKLKLEIINKEII